MKEIQLTQGKVALVDDEDYERVNALKWYAGKFGHKFYAQRANPKGTVPCMMKMHRFIMNQTDPKAFIDHINGDPLDNRKINLRLCTHQENMMNRIPLKGSSSKYLGVSWHKRHKKWYANIRLDGKLKFIGCYHDEEEAAKAYDKKARELFGEFASPNFG